MQNDVRTYVAYTAAQLTANWREETLWDRNREEQIDVKGNGLGFEVKQHPAREGCEANTCRDGVNHCLVGSGENQHICLSVYGALFDGFSQESGCHFSGMVFDDAVEIYDYDESEFFRFEKR